MTEQAQGWRKRYWFKGEDIGYVWQVLVGQEIRAECPDVQTANYILAAITEREQLRVALERIATDDVASPEVDSLSLGMRASCGCKCAVEGIEWCDDHGPTNVAQAALAQQAATPANIAAADAP